ncbi:MAG: hypothetical protein IT289_06635 [Oligoflexia bacterium]|nr:hypothetical protein [Oligoflexia bacterium]
MKTGRCFALTVGLFLVACSQGFSSSGSSVQSGGGFPSPTLSPFPSPSPSPTGSPSSSPTTSPSPTASPTPLPPLKVDRFFQDLDDGTVIAVDNWSRMTRAEIGEIVKRADRSTQTQCPSKQPYKKGLFKQGDRIFVSDYYLAWFDLTTNDGVKYATHPQGPFSLDWERSGELAGIWTLDPLKKNFKYFSKGSECSDWARNELIPGSASPNGEQHWWDKFAPAVEHAMLVESTREPKTNLFIGFHYARQSQGSSKWTQLIDGVLDTDGVRYKYSGFLTGPIGKVKLFAVDLADGDDTVVSHVIESQIEYLMKEKEIISIWKYRALHTDVKAKNIFTYTWNSYAQDMDIDAAPQQKPYCDQGADQELDGSQWPSPSLIPEIPLFAKGKKVLAQNWKSLVFPLGAVVPMVWGDPCPGFDPPYMNHDIFTVATPVDGDWMEWGSDSTLSDSKPIFRYTHLDKAGTGTGSEQDPIHLTPNYMTFSNERRDGTMGGGIQFRKDFIVLKQGQWHEVKFSIQTTRF